MNAFKRPFVGLLLFALLAVMLPTSLFAAPAAQGTTYTGQILAAYANCGLTQIFGTVHDGAGAPQVGLRLRVSWQGGAAETVSGQYVRAETDASGFDFTLDSQAKDGSWTVEVLDGIGTPISQPLVVTTTADCTSPAASNVVKVAFRVGPQPVPPQPIAPAPVPPQPIGPQPVPVQPVPIESGAECRFYSETSFSACNDGGARFLDTVERYGLEKIGYPISHRYERDGFVTQAFQKSVLQWRPESNSVAFVNVFDELHAVGFDQDLLLGRQTPQQLPAGWDGPRSFDEIVERRQGLLNVRPALAAAYFSVGDPLLFFGLPTSEVVDMGNHYAVRLQRSVLQEWKEDVPWASAGQVTVANGGDIAKELGHLPASALAPIPAQPAPIAPAPVQPAPVQPAPVPVQPVPPAPAPSEPPRTLDPRLGQLGVGITDANVASGQLYWRVTSIIWHDDQEAGGRHSIYVDAYAGGERAVGELFTAAWSTGNAVEVVKPDAWGGNYPMYHAGCSYWVHMNSHPSDTVTCLGLGILGPTREWRTDHVEYLLRFELVQKP